MDWCPSEIWLNIFNLACDDGGYTGCSLSLVSPCIHILSKPMRYRSVALHGLRRMRYFAEVMEATPPELRRVRHLYISFRDPPPQAITGSDKPGGLDEQRRTDDAWKCAEAIYQILPSVLSAVAHSLESLTLVTSNDRPFALSPIPLPKILELTIYGIHEVSEWSNPESPHSLPTLRRLHLQGCTRNAVVPLVRLAPNLTHIRMSSIEHGSSIRAIIEEFHSRDVADHGDSSPSTTRPSARRILLQPRAPRTSGCAYAFWRQEGRRSDFEDAVRSDSFGMVTVLEPKRDPGHGDELDQEAKDFWLDRNDGGEGCWKEPEMSQDGALNAIPFPGSLPTQTSQ
ncbi:hypothetical protein JAAARDRAFT_54144 [Jaapia argillacea MUCL 33604]|uniref:F-box domain-containing protein n=1 Tax=Jaapia argillacea MUCL 33604 TaxID=933084 RepID=A0A067Q4Z7_9AGAM|nr:hypothetical protein JAAARDRAFT_54144 [Jaapia argillacea MUCL 33604]